VTLVCHKVERERCRRANDGDLLDVPEVENIDTPVIVQNFPCRMQMHRTFRAF
jgi:hypothetical protein